MVFSKDPLGIRHQTEDYSPIFGLSFIPSSDTALVFSQKGLFFVSRTNFMVLGHIPSYPYGPALGNSVDGKKHQFLTAGRWDYSEGLWNRVYYFDYLAEVAVDSIDLRGLYEGISPWDAQLLNEELLLCSTWRGVSAVDLQSGLEIGRMTLYNYTKFQPIDSGRFTVVGSSPDCREGLISDYLYLYDNETFGINGIADLRGLMVPYFNELLPASCGAIAWSSKLNSVYMIAQTCATQGPLVKLSLDPFMIVDTLWLDESPYVYFSEIIVD